MYLKIKRLSIVLGMIAMLFIISLSFKSKAADNNINVNIEYGIEGHTKMGLHAPLYIKLDNISNSFNGYVQVVISSLFYTNTYNDSASSTLFTDGYKEKNYLLEKQFSAKAGEEATVSLVIPLVNKKNQIKINVYDENDILIKSYDELVETEEYYLSTYIGIISDNQGLENYFNNSDMYKYTDYSIKTVNLDSHNIPFENYGLEIFDILVVNNLKLNELSQVQRNVIKNWEKNGGIISVVTDEQESSAVSWEDFISADNLKNMNQLQYYKYWTISSSFNNIHIDSSPNIYLYIIVLLIYIIVIGPVMYYILKKLNKRGRFWLVESVCSFLFMTIIIFIGKNTRFSAPFVSYFNINTYEDSNISDTYYFNIQAPYNNEYKLFLDNTYSIVPIYDYIYNYDTKKIQNTEDYNIGITYKESENMLTIRNDSPFTKEYFAAEKISNNTGSENVDISMNLFMDKAAGSVTNNFDFNLENACIFTYNKAVFIGDIKAHETISLDELSVYTYNPKFKYGITNKAVNMKLNSTGIIDNDELLLNQKKGFLDLYLDERFSVYNPKGYLVGFRSDTNNFDIQLDTGYKSYGLSVVEIPFEINYSKDEMSYLSYVPISNENYALTGEIMYSDEMVFTYKLGSLKDITLYFTNISYYNDSYYREFNGRIYLLNRKTQLYDPVDKEKSIVLAKDLEQYLNEDNEVVIKYAQELNSDSKEALIPSVSAVGRTVSHTEGKEDK